MTGNILIVGRTTALAPDFSDLSKPFGGEGVEGMAKGWDGSSHCTAYGHDFISVSIVGPSFADAVPVYVKIARGRKRNPTSLSSRFPTRPDRIDFARCC